MKEITEERLKTAKEEIEEKIPQLKRDSERLNEFIGVMEDVLKNATVNNVQGYQDKLDGIIDSFESIDVW